MKFVMHHTHRRILIVIGAFLAGCLVVAAVVIFVVPLLHIKGNTTPPVAVDKPTQPSGALPPHTPSTPVVPEPTAPAKLTPNYTIPPAQDGMAPVLYRIPTDLPVVYLGIDDGASKTQEEVELLAKNKIKASLFLSDLFIAANPEFFKAIIAQGSVVENHTLSHHTKMVQESYEFQKNEICGMADKIEQYYGRRPTLFRPPGGAYSDSLRRAAHDCGMKAVVTWIAKANGGSMQYQIGNKLRPGDIVLMHFRPEFAKDLQAFVEARDAAGLQTELLEDLPGAQ